MTKEFKAGEGAIDPSKIQQQYAEIEQRAANKKEPTLAEIKKMRAEEEKEIDEILPYLRKKAEATKLEMSLVEMDVRMGRFDPKNLPGLLGKQLQIETFKLQQEWARLQLDQSAMMAEAMKQKAELEEMQRKESEKQKGEKVSG